MNEITDQVPYVVPGESVTIQLKSREFYTVDAHGNKSDVQYLPSVPGEMIVRDADRCYSDDWAEDYRTIEEASHTHTICPDCIESWAIDYHVVLTSDLTMEGLI